MQEAQSSVTSMEFVKWMAFEEMRSDSPKPEHYYLARIAMEIRAIFHKNPKSLKIDDFLLKFLRGQDSQKMKAEEQLNQSKITWAGFAARFGFRKREPERIP